MKLFTRRYSESGQPLVILHGLFGNQGNWAWHAGELSGAFAVSAMDLRNHGRSDWDDEHTYRRMAEDVLETMDAHGIEQTYLLGHSMGGKTAMQLALLAPERISRLVVVDIAPVTYPKTDYLPLKAMSAVPLDAISSRSEADKVMSGIEPEAAVREFLLTNLQRDKQGGFQWRCNLQAIANNFPQIISWPDDATGTFSKPTLFIKGEQSDYILAEHRATIEGYFSDPKLKVISNAGHWVHSEKPQVFQKIVQDFLT